MTVTTVMQTVRQAAHPSRVQLTLQAKLKQPVVLCQSSILHEPKSLNHVLSIRLEVMLRQSQWDMSVTPACKRRSR